MPPIGNFCFICKEMVFGPADTDITIRRHETDEKTGLQRTWIWSGTVCDNCLKRFFGWEAK